MTETQTRDLLRAAWSALADVEGYARLTRSPAEAKRIRARADHLRAVLTSIEKDPSNGC